MPLALVCYFLGTGNTFRAAYLIGNLLKDAGYEIQSRSIEHGPTTGSFDLEVFAFPVYSFAPPAAMIRYIKALPKANSRAAILAIHGEPPIRPMLPGCGLPPGPGPGLAGSTRFSYTRGFRRYLAPGYYPSDGRSVEVEKGV
jgi:hypothetical protein